MYSVLLCPQALLTYINVLAGKKYFFLSANFNIKHVCIPSSLMSSIDVHRSAPKGTRAVL